jgi:CheY-like chemotaxis protein
LNTDASSSKKTFGKTQTVPKAPSPQLMTILLVDDMDASRIATKWFLNNFGYEVDSARSAEEALAVFDNHTHDLIVTDCRMPGMSGLELAHVVKMRSPSTPVIMYSGAAPPDRSCLDYVILKPAHLLVLKAAVEELLAARTHD